MQKLTFNVNNGEKLELSQSEHDGTVYINKFNKVSPGDMVMLINYYRYVKRENIQCDFINPNGRNKMEV